MVSMKLEGQEKIAAAVDEFSRGGEGRRGRAAQERGLCDIRRGWRQK